MKRFILPQEGQFYKANLHCHSTFSDGQLTPAQLKQAYQSYGYSIVAFTDHGKLFYHNELNDDSFLALPAFEAGIDDWGSNGGTNRVYHLNIYDFRENPDVSDNESLHPERRYRDTDYINQYIETMNQKGFLVCYNHPYWSLQTAEDYINLHHCFAMEIYNHACEIEGANGYAPQVYDEMLRHGIPLCCVAADDNHHGFPKNHPSCDAFGGFTMIKAQGLSQGMIFDALKNGSFYASAGPEIYELYLDGKTLVIRCSDVKSIYVITQDRTAYTSFAQEGGSLTSASFELSGTEGYVRLELRDSRGYKAWTNAYRLNPTNLD